VNAPINQDRFSPEGLKALLAEYDKAAVDVFAGYCLALLNEKDREKKPKNPWMAHRSNTQLAGYYKAVIADGLTIDGKHVTIQKTGVSYDYVAYKNKMLLAYPESLIDVSLVYKDDNFAFAKESGRVVYTHKINNPFGQFEQDVIGGYCVIKNKRGEFLTLLSAADIEKHRKVAKTDSIWKSWFAEMALKTIVKKACKQHFADIFQSIETLDNENYDVEQPLGISVETKAAIEALNTVDELNRYYHQNKAQHAGIMQDFVDALARRKEQIKGGTDADN
jgi:hypothetical protein